MHFSYAGDRNRTPAHENNTKRKEFSAVFSIDTYSLHTFWIKYIQRDKSMRDLMEIIIENLTNERLDEIVFTDEEFCSIDSQLDEALAKYNNLSITKQDAKLINEIFDLYVVHSARYAALAYRQGLEDSIHLLKAIDII